MKIKNLETRRSIRSYDNKQVSQEIINDILSASLYVPTSMGTQPFKIILVKKGTILQEVFAPMVNGQKHVLEADFVTFIYAVKNTTIPFEWIKSKLYYIAEDKRDEIANGAIEQYKHKHDFQGSAHVAAFAMALEADANEVGSTIFTGFNHKALTEYFKNDIDPVYELVVGVSFGYKSPSAVVYPKPIKPLSDFLIVKK